MGGSYAHHINLLGVLSHYYIKGGLINHKNKLPNGCGVFVIAITMTLQGSWRYRSKDRRPGTEDWGF